VQAAQRLTYEQKQRAELFERREKEQKEAAKRLRRRAFVSGGAASVALVLLIVSVLVWRMAVDQRIGRSVGSGAQAQSQEVARIAESRRLAAESSAAHGQYPQRSVLLAAEAARIGQSVSGGAVKAAEQS